ncbi:MAG: hypothetical protein ACRD21_24095, partial [Vicinamibacteria bacterium]
MRKKLDSLALVLAAIAVASSALGQTAPAGPLRIRLVTPSGTDVPGGRQIVIQFDRKVVPVGRMERRPDEVSVAIDPPLECEWRWLDTSSLACQLGEADAFRPATRYRMTISPGIRTESGETLEAPLVHEFETERPKVTHTRFERWLGPGSPELTVTFNQGMSAEGVGTRLHFEDEGGTRFPVEAELADATVENPDRFWRIRPQNELPLGSSIFLVAGAGLTSQEGPLPTLEAARAVNLHTFPRHEFLGIRCWDNQGNPITLKPDETLPPRPCNPMALVEVVFAAPVVKEVLGDGLKLDPDLGGGREDYDPWEALYSYSRLEWVRSAGADYATRLPELLRARTTYRIQAEGSSLLDEFGRPLPEDIDFLFTTDDRPPRAALTHPISTLEKNVDSRVPIVVTNLDALDFEVETLTADGSRRITETIALPKAPNVAYRYPLPTRDWLSGRSGVLFANART